MSEAADVIQLHQLRSNSERSVASSHQGWIEVWNIYTTIILLVIITLFLKMIPGSPLRRCIYSIIIVIWLYNYYSISLIVCYIGSIRYFDSNIPYFIPFPFIKVDCPRMCAITDVSYSISPCRYGKLRINYLWNATTIANQVSSLCQIILSEWHVSGRAFLLYLLPIIPSNSVSRAESGKARLHNYTMIINYHSHVHFFYIFVSHFC